MDNRKSTTYHTIKSLRAARSQIREEIDLAKANLFVGFFTKKEEASMTENAFEAWVNRIKIIFLAYNGIRKLTKWYHENFQ